MHAPHRRTARLLPLAAVGRAVECDIPESLLSELGSQQYRWVVGRVVWLVDGWQALMHVLAEEMEAGATQGAGARWARP